MSDSSQRGTWFYYTSPAFRASSTIIKASDVTPPVARLKWGMSVHCGRKQRGQRPSVCALFMLLVNWPAAVCSREIALSLKRTFSSHTAGLQVSSGGVPHKTLFHFVFPPSVILQWPCLNAAVFLVYQPWVRQRAIFHLSVCFQYMCAVFFSFFLFPFVSPWCAGEHNAILNYWDLGNSFLLSPSTNIFLSRTQ